MSMLIAHCLLLSFREFLIKFKWGNLFKSVCALDAMVMNLFCFVLDLNVN